MSIQCYSLSMQFKEVLAAGKDDQYQLGTGGRADAYVQRKYAQGSESNFLQKSAKPPSAMQGPETHNSYTPSEVSMTFGMNKTERKNAIFEMVQISSGQQHSMALTKDGSVFSWGLGLSGQLGLTYDQIAENDTIIARVANAHQREDISYQRRIDFCPPTYSKSMPRNDSKDFFNPDLANDTGVSVSDSRQAEGLFSAVQEADGIYLNDRRF